MHVDGEAIVFLHLISKTAGFARAYFHHKRQAKGQQCPDKHGF
eukprot:XP_001709243.1 Hypothetical protein GL50803_38856 [Giardia lamblia ATCC 50803]